MSVAYVDTPSLLAVAFGEPTASIKHCLWHNCCVLYRAIYREVSEVIREG